MRILFLTHSFNSLSQRLFVELTRRGHEISIEFDINDAITVEAVHLYQPDLIVAPFLKRAIPETVWRQHCCLIVHPGIPGDRGPCALDWAIMNAEREWGVTVLQATAEMDAGPIWASARFPMRAASKSSLYRNEVAEAATVAVLEAIGRFESGTYSPEPLDYTRKEITGRLRPAMKQSARAIDWERDSAETVVRKIRAADGFPGVLDELYGKRCYLHGAHLEDGLRGRAGEVVAQRNGAICRATRDGAVWITHLRAANAGEKSFKLAAGRVLEGALQGVAEVSPLSGPANGRQTHAEITYCETGEVGYLHFDFYNGAMGAEQCVRLKEAYIRATGRPTRVIVLMGGKDFWSNGIDLNSIEAAESAADESWRNINAMDDLARAIIETRSQITIAALQANAGAGGVFLALAADRVCARSGVILNPHYKSMGNLFGSEYWTYLLPRRVGEENARALVENRLPIGVAAATEIGLVDERFGQTADDFERQLAMYAGVLAASPEHASLLAEKRAGREQDEREKPLEQYRAEELECMKLNFYGFDPSYHVARYNFVHKAAHSWTPLHLARHRRQHAHASRRGSAA